MTQRINCSPVRSLLEMTWQSMSVCSQHTHVHTAYKGATVDKERRLTWDEAARTTKYIAVSNVNIVSLCLSFSCPLDCPYRENRVIGLL